MKEILKKTFEGLRGLLSGMALTFRYLVHPDKVITQQYPENRAQLKLPPRARSRIELIKDEQNGVYRCTACGLCVRACPNNSIEVIRDRDPVTQKAKLNKFIYHFERCTICGLCVDACRSEALRMGQQFETAVYDSAQLTIILNKDSRPAGEEPASERKTASTPSETEAAPRPPSVSAAAIQPTPAPSSPAA